MFGEGGKLFFSAIKTNMASFLALRNRGWGRGVAMEIFFSFASFSLLLFGAH
jgi:hypothetical protein